MAEALCPLCKGMHKLKQTKPGRKGRAPVPYLTCPVWKQQVFFNEGPGSDYLTKNQTDTEPRFPEEGDLVDDL